ncbi:MAG: hypothetical protein MK212_00940 [Saprospiraceae bacterium]|nr:hypothetical protein [Saprospiraceae bacterium]
MKNWLLIYLCISPLSLLLGQASTNLPLNDDNHRILERMEIKTSDFKGLHNQIQPISRKDARSFVESMDTLAWIKGSKRNMADLNYILTDNNDEDSTIKSKKPFLKWFYRTPAHLYEVRKKHFYVNINPIFHFTAGLDRYNGSNNFTFINRRGAAIRGNIAGKVYFYTDIIDSQAGYPSYVRNRILSESAVPGMGFYKQYNSSLTAAADDGVDFLMSQGYIGFNIIEQIGVQMGHGRNFIGDGYRSLFLSDFSNNYFYLKLNTRVWRIHYQNVFAELIQNYDRGLDRVLPKKYMAAHYLSINVLKNLNIGLFETVIFGRDRGFELQYLNPLILYRTVEQAVGSPDNVMLGLSWKYNFLKRFSFYGQFILDEFRFSKMVATNPAERGWWANKYGLQVGIKYVDVAGIDHLDLQVEYNTVRPYTYTFRDSSANYTHYNQPLAHPLGANFQEVIGIINYQPIPKLGIRAQLNYARYGLDTLSSNWGKNVHLSYTTREEEYGNKTGQGTTTNLLVGLLWVSYQVRHNLYLDLQYRYRREDAALDNLDNSAHILSLGIRWNISERLNDF